MTAVPNTPASPSRANPLRVAEGCWMIGYRNPASLLQCNTYLRQFSGPRNGTNICVDPGSQFDASVIEANISSLTGDGGVDFITVNHQDPDVTGNLPDFCHNYPAATVMLSEDTWRLVQHLLVRPGQLQFPLPLASRRQIVRDGIAWQSVPTPFCHFRGAMAWYDPEARILFSGDLFGGLNQLGRVHLFAEESDWQGIALFHQIYMPTREVLRYAVRQIRSLSPAVQVIAPQHGHIIAGDLVPLFLERMDQLLVGADLLAIELDRRYAHEFTDLVALLIERAREIVGPDEVDARLHATGKDDPLAALLAQTGQEWQVLRTPYACSAEVFTRLAHGEEPAVVEDLRNEVLQFCAGRAVPVPPIGWGMEVRSQTAN
jgi:glyoxylase-like metal-dependent hydrolase (beta-lactamase superfamily II)